MGLKITAKIDGVQLGANRHGRADKITLVAAGLPIETLVQLAGRYKQTVTLEIVDEVQPALPGLRAVPDDESEEQQPAERFWIDEGSFPIYRPFPDADFDENRGEYNLTGRELRELVDGAEQLWQWVEDPFNAGQRKRELVEDSAVISLQDGDHFTIHGDDQVASDEEEPAEDAGEDADDAQPAPESEEHDLNRPEPVAIGSRRRGGAE